MMHQKICKTCIARWKPAMADAVSVHGSARNTRHRLSIGLFVPMAAAMSERLRIVATAPITVLLDVIPSIASDPGSA
jgi:hypothetical protein